MSKTPEPHVPLARSLVAVILFGLAATALTAPLTSPSWAAPPPGQAPEREPSKLQGMRDQVADAGRRADALEAEAKAATRRGLTPMAIKRYREMALELDGQMEILEYLAKHEEDASQRAADTVALEAVVDRIVHTLELVEFLQKTKS